MTEKLVKITDEILYSDKKLYREALTTIAASKKLGDIFTPALLTAQTCAMLTGREDAIDEFYSFGLFKYMIKEINEEFQDPIDKRSIEIHLRYIFDPPIIPTNSMARMSISDSQRDYIAAQIDYSIALLDPGDMATELPYPTPRNELRIKDYNATGGGGCLLPFILTGITFLIIK